MGLPVLKGENTMLHDNLRKARMNKGISQEQLAVQLNVVRQTVSKWEKGTSVPDAETLVRLSEVLEIPVNTLLDEAKPQEAVELSDVARQLAQMNELTALKMQREKEMFDKVKKGAIALLVILFVAAILPQWSETCREFGRNLYHVPNPGK